MRRGRAARRVRLLVELGVGVALSVLGGSARAQFSPGDLAAPHAHLEGMGHCERCHPPGGQVSDAKCLACHDSLAKRIAAGKGYHGRLPAAARAECHNCHHEHQGKDFSLIDWPGGMERFEHTSTGFRLEGAHQRVACRRCHDRAAIVDPDILALLDKHPKTKTFLGVGGTCANCHGDEHRGQLGTACETCHTSSAWKPAPGFDHGKTRYPLQGKHRVVACKGCHPSRSDTAELGKLRSPLRNTFAQLRDIPHGACTDCHADPHKRAFGQRCQSCHTTDSWHSIKAGTDISFHDKTRYPLVGAHRTVECARCHGPFADQRNAVFKGLAHDRCATCHSDAHRGQLGKVETTGACERCHAVEGFVPVRFLLAAHAETSYPLAGAHQAVACARCHPRTLPDDPALRDKLDKLARKGKATQQSAALLRLTNHGGRCADCHADPHAGQFGERAQACDTCHVVSSFRVASFDHDRRSRFPLSGAHRNAACASCHQSAKIGNAEVRRFVGTPMACAQCHADIHYGQLERQGAGCERCHTTGRFTELVFRHDEASFTLFPLEGKHAAVACDRCHPTVEVGAGLQTRRYKPVPTTCQGCHTDVHHGAFKGFTP